MKRICGVALGLALLNPACLPDPNCYRPEDCIDGWSCYKRSDAEGGGQRCKPVDPFAITTSELPVAIIGERYSAPLVATGGIEGYTWELGEGAPAWLSVDGSALTGTPPGPRTENQITVIAWDGSYFEPEKSEPRRAERALRLKLEYCDERLTGEQCSGHGRCLTHECQCDVGHDGSQCELCDNGYHRGADGEVCTTDPCDASPRPCGGEHQYCQEGPGGEAECACDEDYRDYGDGACRPVDPCNPNPCTDPHGAECSNELGRPVCACDDGYELGQGGDRCVQEETRCQPAACGADVERRECVDGVCSDWAVAADCPESAVCVESEGAAQCSPCDLQCSNGKCVGCLSGPCCDAQGEIKAAGEECGLSRDYQCTQGCGGKAQEQVIHQRCNGITPACEGEIAAEPWADLDQCEAVEQCVADLAGASCDMCANGCQGEACCECSTGACCDGCRYYTAEAGQVCETLTERQCGGTGCGADVIERTGARKCEGGTSDCTGGLSWSDFSQKTDCAASDLCIAVGGEANCSTCSFGCANGQCNECMPGMPCCDSNGRYRLDTWQCGSRTEYQCAGGCAGTAQQQLVRQYCDGISGECTGQEVADGWLAFNVCEDNEVCVTDGVAIPECQPCGALESCVGNACQCTYTSCNGYCCGEGQICYFSGSCGRQQMLVASDAQANDKFGYSVGISGEWVAVGAPEEDGGAGDPMTNAGAVYLYISNGDNWQENAKVTPLDHQIGDQFGYSLSISSGFLAIGAPYEDGGGGDPRTDAGAVYIFKNINGTWQQMTKISATDPQQGDQFGFSVSIECWSVLDFYNCVLAVGAPGEDGGNGNPTPSSGAVYFYSCGLVGIGFTDCIEWSAGGKVAPPDAESGDELGYSVDVINNGGIFVYAGAPGDDGIAGDQYLNSGSVIELERDCFDQDDCFFMRKRLYSMGPFEGERFGSSVDSDSYVDGYLRNEIAVGRKSSHQEDDYGRADVFRDADHVSVAHPMDLGGGVSTSVSISGSRLLLGCFQFWSEVGLFELVSDVWRAVGRFLGYSLTAIDGGTMVLGDFRYSLDSGRILVVF